MTQERLLEKKHCNSCGQIFRPWRKTGRYCSRECLWKENGGWNRKPGPIWWKNNRGYIEGRVWIDGKRVQVKQHRWAVQNAIGRALFPNEAVHHKNGDRTDNRLANLEIMPYGKHSAHHNRDPNRKRGGRFNAPRKNGRFAK